MKSLPTNIPPPFGVRVFKWLLPVVVTVVFAGAAGDVQANKPVVRGKIYVYGTNAPLNNVEIVWTDRRDKSGCQNTPITFEQQTSIKVKTGQGYSWSLGNRSGTVTVAAGEYAFEGNASGGGRFGCNCGPHDFKAIKPDGKGYFTNAAGQVTDVIAEGIDFNDPNWGGGNVGETTPDLPPLYWHSEKTVIPDTPTPTLSPTNTPTPTPTITPTHTPSPTPTLTPTPAQVQQIINQPEARALAPAKNTASLTTQRWFCLETKPCSVASSSCSGRGNADHRVKLGTKKDVKANPNEATYVFECLMTPAGPKCTSGSSTTDRSALGSDNLSYLKQNVGYAFKEFVFLDGSPSSNPLVSSSDGTIGSKEWESYTGSEVNRIFLGMNNTSSNSSSAFVGAQQQGGLTFDAGGDKKCLQIRWDPYGFIFNAKTLEPLAGARVLLLQKRADGSFTKVMPNEIYGGLENPIVTGADGAYNFHVPDGTYKLEVLMPGFRQSTAADLNSLVNGRYFHIYDGREIVQDDEHVRVDVGMYPLHR